MYEETSPKAIGMATHSIRIPPVDAADEKHYQGHAYQELRGRILRRR